MFGEILKLINKKITFIDSDKTIETIRISFYNLATYLYKIAKLLCPTKQKIELKNTKNVFERLLLNPIWASVGQIQPNSE